MNALLRRYDRYRFANKFFEDDKIDGEPGDDKKEDFKSPMDNALGFYEDEDWNNDNDITEDDEDDKKEGDVKEGDDKEEEDDKTDNKEKDDKTDDIKEDDKPDGDKEDEEEDEKEEIKADDYQDFVNEFKKDPPAAYRKYGNKFKLPNPSQLAQYFDTGDKGRDARVKARKSQIEKDLEEEFDLKKGFKYNSADEYEPGTPTYEFRRRMRGVEDQIEREIADDIKANEERNSAILAQNKKDITAVADNYFEGDAKKVQDLIKEMGKKRSEVSNGKLGHDEDPLSLRNVLRGYKFEEFVELEVGKRLNAFVEKLTADGYQLPNLKDYPLDLSKVSGKKKTEDKDKEKDKKFTSPLEYEMNNIY